MKTLALETEPIAVDLSVTEDDLVVSLSDGRRIFVPLAWYPRLLNGSSSERQNWQLLGNGYAIEWPDLDEHIGVEGLLAGRHSGESSQSLNRWLASRRSADTSKVTP
ncbi:MAG: DUF2442 domain-containing protein [Candidatus Sumerlaeota bacterium]|nr:DUF2442 domain-containing protein [Candidatus Sumerlaeota bacterium]